MKEALIRTVYWDACTFLGLINREADKHADCRSVWDEVERGEVEIVTSFFTFAEVFKVKCEDSAKPLSDDGEDLIAGFFASDKIVPRVMDRAVVEKARRLMRKHPACKKPSDAVHLASALLMNVDEMHTYDGSDLLILSEKVSRADGELLTICTPYVAQPDLLQGIKSDDDQAE